MPLSTAFLTTVLQDYGRSQGLSIDALTFTHHVLSDTADLKEKELSLIIQKKLNIVRRAFKVLACRKAQKERPPPCSLSPSFPRRALIRPLAPRQAPGWTLDRRPGRGPAPFGPADGVSAPHSGARPASKQKPPPACKGARWPSANAL